MQGVGRVQGLERTDGLGRARVDAAGEEAESGRE